MKRIFSILLLIVMCHMSFAIDVKDIVVRNISTEQGLSHHTVNAIWQDEFGFIWIGTLDGLNRFDGHHFKVFRPDVDDSHSIRENNIRQICGDGDGHLYIKGLTSLSEFDMRTCKFKLLADNIKEITFAQGNLWVSQAKSISIYDNKTDQFIERFHFSDESLNNAVIAGFSVGQSGRIYIRTSKDGLFFVNENGNIDRHLNIDGVTSVLEDKHGNVWIGTFSNGVYALMNDGQMLHFHHEGSNPGGDAYDNIRSLCEDKEGDIWMSTYGGLVKIDVDKEKRIHYRYEFEYDAYNIRSISPIFYDRQGTLWFGSFHSGVSIYNPDSEKYNYYRAESGDFKGGLNSVIVSSFDEDENGRVFIGTEGGWVNVLDSQNGDFQRLAAPKSLEDKVVKCMLYNAHEKMLYVSTLYGGITRIDMSVDGGLIVSEPGETDGAGNMVSMVEYGRDSIILGTNMGIRVYDKPSGMMTAMKTGFKSMYHSQVWDVAIDDDKNLWFTTSSDLYCYDLKNDMTRRYVFSDIVSNTVNNHFNHILKDSKGRLWIGSSGSGFFLYDKQSDTFRQFSEQNGLPSGFITEICEDPTTGIIYVATAKGLVSYDSENDVLKNCDVSNNSHISFIRNMFIAKNGELFVSDLAGMVSVNCDNLNSSARDYDVFVSGIMVDNVPSSSELDALYQREIHLSPSHTSVSFEITNTDFLNTSDRLAEYKLEGVDQDFVRTTGQHPITYANLSPGKYKFVVRGLVPDLNGEYPQSEIIVYVDKPFYKTWWFICLVLLFIGAIAFYLFRVYAVSLRLRSKNSTNEAKMRFFTNISHEFRTPLTLISGHLDILLQQDNLSPSVYSRILNIHRSTITMNNLVNETVDVMKYEAGKLKLKVARHDVVSFVKEIYVTFNEYARQRDIELTFESYSEGVYLEFDNRQLEKVFFNLLSNAFKYTSAGGKIKIVLKEGQDGVMICVEDNGDGIKPEHIKHVFEMFYQDDKLNASLPGQTSGIGLALSKAIVEMHGGSISVESVPGKCTCFTVMLKYNPVFSGEVIMLDEVSGNAIHPAVSEYNTATAVEGQSVGEKGAKMLIVEDSEEIAELLVSVFSHSYDVMTAPSGEEGLAMAKSEMPDIIVSDVMMPGMTGIEMCRLLKENIETCHIPIVLLTAYALENYVVDGFSMGADDYVTKPFNVKILVARCDNLVRGRRRLQEKYQNLPDSSVNILSNNMKDQKLLENAVAIVKEHMDDPNFKIDVFAHELGLSRTYLFSKIKGLTGQSPNEFITTIRLKEAVVRLTSSSDESISEIAYSLGFSSSSYFINCFKTRYGKTPAQYRKEYK